jgi:hypothetical protein
VPGETLDKLRYPQILGWDSTQTALYSHMQALAWDGNWHQLAYHDNQALLQLQKCEVRFENFTSDRAYDVIYYDAFAPEAQPELWTTEMFYRMFSLLKPGGVLVTYCAKGQVKRNMKAAGFEVERLKGPPGKREMTRAARPA